jgi:VRR-NUC domain.
MHSDGGLFCRTCWELADEQPQPAGMTPRATHNAQMPSTEAITIDSEKALVREITRQLTTRGWRVYHIGQLIARGSGSTPGVPDLLCVKPALPPYAALVRLIEVKFGRNQPSAAQQELIDAGASVAVWSVAEALQATGETEE